MTMDKELLARLDAVAATRGETQSGYVAQAVRERMEREPNLLSSNHLLTRKQP
jgi:predicted transcriptional regulator